MDFGDSALQFEVRCFVSDVDKRLRISSELRFAIDAAFRKASIEIPFPQRDLHLKNAEWLSGAGTAAAPKPPVRKPAKRTNSSRKSRKPAS
jgi:small-conductance mechanosensitive channel